MSARVAIVGAGVSGAACAVALRARGVEVEMFERGRAPGGRMASPVLHGRRTDLGAAYFTVRDPSFAAVVDGWRARELARVWTDTLTVLGPDGRDSTTGAPRWAASGGLRSLVRDLLPVEPVLGSEITALDRLEHDAVVLAMPDPQAARLAPGLIDPVGYDPVIAVAAGWDTRCWDLDDGAFVNDDPDLTLVADDGARRGDGAAVLILHTTARLAGRHLSDPDAAVTPALAALTRVLGVEQAPRWTHAHRWTFAKPSTTHGDRPFELSDHDGRPVGVANDAWCPQGAPRIESAWLSATRLGAALADRVG